MLKFRSAAIASCLFSAALTFSGCANAAPQEGGETAGEEVINSVLAAGFAPPSTAPDIGDEASGPYDRLIIDEVGLIDGTGAPLRGPVRIVIQNDRIASILDMEYAGPLPEASETTRIIDGEGLYVTPGFVDIHTHIGSPTHIYGGALTDPEYVFKLYLAHGVTTVRDAGSLLGLDWTLRHKERSERGEIAAPRIRALTLFPPYIADADSARQWVRWVHAKGADGVKFLGASPNAMRAALEEIQSLGMHSAYHHAQLAVTRIDALDSAEMGLDSLEHWYGLPEAMFEDKQIQHYPPDYNYTNEQHRFEEAGRLWSQTAKPGSDTWLETIDKLIDYDLTINPTFQIYEATRDVSRARTFEWHDEYTMPYIARTFQPNPKAHGSFFFDWTTADEVAWRKNYRIWMDFVNDFKNAGGRVAAGSDSGFIYSVYGFGYVRELEMLQEAGFHPLEVLKSATLNGAELLGEDDDIGTIEVGKVADLVLVGENPVANFKVLYATGHEYYDYEAEKVSRTKGVIYTIKGGIIFDAEKLREDVRELVAAEN